MVAVLLLVSTNDYDAPYEGLLSWNSSSYLKGNDSSCIRIFFPQFVFESCVTHRFLSTVLTLAQCYIKVQCHWSPLMWILPSIYFCPSLSLGLEVLQAVTGDAWAIISPRFGWHWLMAQFPSSSLEWSRMGGILTSAWESKAQDYPFKFWAIWGSIFYVQYTLGNREQFISKTKILKTVWIISLCIPCIHLTK